MAFIEQKLTNKHMMSKEEIEKMGKALKDEFTFFKDISNLGVDLAQLLEHLTFYRSLEVKTLCQEGMNNDSNKFYMVFSGECEIFKTKNEFMVYNEDGEEMLPDMKINSTKGFQSEMNNQSALAAPDGQSQQLKGENQEEQKLKDKTKTDLNVVDKESSLNNLQQSAQKKLEGFILSHTSKRQTKYDGEDQLLFASARSGEIFGQLQYIFPKSRGEIRQPFTIKTNEKTRLIMIDSKAID